MRCTACAFDNAPGIKFCGDCGRSLAPEKSRPPTPDPLSYTPKHLAEKILTTRSALEGERKQVTVLFVDVSYGETKRPRRRQGTTALNRR